MSGPEYGNAMTEIALALAMAFFALMILTMVSMGAGSGAAAHTPKALTVAATTESAPTAGDRHSGQVAATTVAPEQLVIFADGRYYDAALQLLEPASTAGQSGLVLAVPPQLPLAAVMQAKAGLAAEDVTVVPLSADWQAALQGRKP